MRPEGWIPHVTFLTRKNTSWHGNQITILSSLQTGGYAIHLYAGYLHFATLGEATHWLANNDYDNWNAELRRDPTAMTEANAAFTDEYWARQKSEPKQAQVKPTVDPTELLKKLGLV